uniref:hydantoinase/oxoprolinase family protein n=1 Tax=Enterococcus lactis TaxID=357441 RepID=UPI00237B3C8E
FVRMGIDVGGTHTKAVAIDNATHEIIGKSSVKTTHDDVRGVAAGVVQSFQNCLRENCLRENNISPEDVVFVAHSTTQATNALIEGDVAKVGVIGMAKGGLEGFLAKRQTRLNDIDLGNKIKIEIVNAFLPVKHLNVDRVSETISSLERERAEVLVSSMAFGVDNGEPERTRRTRTAAINASILPKMLDTATSTEDSVREAGVNVSLMIMRGDGGVMEINEMKKRPVLTMLSGPAASVMGSLMYLRASNGVYFEVGGTKTTNIGVIKNGRPAIDYSIVGGHPTYISSLDVRVLGVAGGSMVRANQSGIIDVGPRSAHIAGLDYAVFTETEKIKGPKVEFFSPKEGDPADYVKVVMEDGEEVTITNTCAANVLGLVQEEHFSYGNVPSARKAIISLVGVGGGAASLITYFSNKMGVKYSIPENAEVISSIGVALALKNEAMNKAIESGATPESIEVHVEIDPQTSKVTAIATGSTEVKATDLTKEITTEEALELAAEDMRLNKNEVCLLENTPFFYVCGEQNRSKNAGSLRIIDQKGFIKVQRGHASCLKTTAANYMAAVEQLWEDMAVYQTELIARPEFYLCLGARVSDFTATDLEQLQLLMDLEVSTMEPEEEVIVVAGNIKQT